MSRASMVAALPGPHPTLFGIGSYRAARGQVDFEIGWAEFERDVRWAHRVLATWDIQAGDHVVLSTPNYEGPWTSPLIRALRALRTVHSNTEPYNWDARRSATFLRLLPVKAYIGLAEPVATALLETGLLTNVPLLLTRPDAVEPLRANGLAPAVFAMLGPALALECPQRAGAHLDPAEWRVEAVGGNLVLTTVGARAHLARDLDLGVTGAVDDSPCPCGLPGRRIRLDLA
jgi:hypothetical protein